MWSMPLGVSISPFLHPHSPLNNLKQQSSFLPAKGFLPKKAGVCKVSPVADSFSTSSQDVFVREARLEEYWEIAEIYCSSYSSYLPEYSFPLNLVLRIDKILAMVSGLSVPKGCHRNFLVAVIGSSGNETLFGSEELRIGVFDTRLSLNKGHVAGILTVDTVADFLPLKGPTRQRTTGIAYISSVAVHENFRRMGIAKRLIATAEAQARAWGCRSVALHCELNNHRAMKLYRELGFKCISVPEGAKWPQPTASPDFNFSFMMKLLKLPSASAA